tara:strand:- start:564 stop:761 length:198 start_codon:yes stop_codon:yes gene_type:complete
MVIVKGKLMLDYAYPCMMAEKALKKLHEAMLNREFDAAKEAALVVLVETKLTLNAINDMHDRDRG